MDERSTIQIPQNQETSIAVIKNELGHVNTGIKDIKDTLNRFETNFAKHSDLANLVVQVSKLSDAVDKKANHSDFVELSKSKLDKDDFKPIQKTLSRINWILISSIVVALLAMLYKAGGQ